jgi:hypothetical protein
MGHISYPRPKPKPKFVHEVNVSPWEGYQPWLAELLTEITGSTGFKKRRPFWAYTVFSFVHKEQAGRLERELRERRELRVGLEAKARPCPVPVRVRYEEAIPAPHAVIWGLSRGVIREVVRVYRRSAVMPRPRFG